MSHFGLLNSIVDRVRQRFDKRRRILFHTTREENSSTSVSSAHRSTRTNKISGANRSHWTLGMPPRLLASSGLFIADEVMFLNSMVSNSCSSKRKVTVARNPTIKAQIEIERQRSNQPILEANHSIPPILPTLHPSPFTLKALTKLRVLKYFTYWSIHPLRLESRAVMLSFDPQATYAYSMYLRVK